MRNLLFLTVFLFCFSCENNIENPTEKRGSTLSSSTTSISLPYAETDFETFEMAKGETTYEMKKYFVAFLKSGPNRNQSEEEAAAIQKAHRAHLSQLAEEKRLCLVGPMGDDGDIRGMIVFSVPSLEEAERLAALDPAVKAGRLELEIHPWWAAKGSELF